MFNQGFLKMPTLTTLIDLNVVTPILHARKTAIKCWDDLLTGCETLSCFTNRINKYAKQISKAETVDFFDKYGEDGANSFKGDICEIFAEFILKRHGSTWGINNYTPLFIDPLVPEKDVGVDGTGTTNDGRIVTVQIKYGDWSQTLDYTKRRLSTFHWTSLSKYKVGTTSTDQMFVFTLARDIGWETLDVRFHGRLKFIALEESGRLIYNESKEPMEMFSIKSVCKDNPIFWNSFYQMVKEVKEVS